MDCCYGLGAGAWDYPMPYAPYAYYADPYRYYRYDYSHHAHHSEHNMAMEYSAYASKEARMRRSFSRRSHTPAHLPIPPTSPIECGMNARPSGYCDPPMWSHYQMGMMGGWGGGSQSAWSRLPFSRENMRYPIDCRPNKGPSMHTSNQMGIQDGRSTPYPTYDDSRYVPDTGRAALNATDQNVRNLPPAENAAKRFYPEVRPPVEEKRPPIVPLPAFQQAFGSTEIGKFAEAFSRTELPVDEENTENFGFDSFQDWENPTENQSQWSAAREIKCEENF